jgi:hypothetical protein
LALLAAPKDRGCADESVPETAANEREPDMAPVERVPADLMRCNAASGALGDRRHLVLAPLDLAGDGGSWEAESDEPHVVNAGRNAGVIGATDA